MFAISLQHIATSQLKFVLVDRFDGTKGTPRTTAFVDKHVGLIGGFLTRSQSLVLSKMPPSIIIISFFGKSA